MPDPSTPSPSDPDHTGNPSDPYSSGENTPQRTPGYDDFGDNPPADRSSDSLAGQSQKPGKLKLKKVFTPLSPHLKVEHHEDDARIEKKKVFKPSPRAVPIEPEPELTPDELAALGRDKSEIMQPPIGEGYGQSGTPEVGIAPPEESEEVFEERVSSGAPAPTPRKSRKLILAVSVPVVLVIAIGLLVNFLWDPLGLKIEAIEQLPHLSPVQQASQAAETTPFGTTKAPTPAGNFEDQDIDAYLGELRKQKISLAGTPGCIFIDSVYLEEGHLINPQFGLKFVSLNAKEGLCLLEDASGQTFEIEID